MEEEAERREREYEASRKELEVKASDRSRVMRGEAVEGQNKQGAEKLKKQKIQANDDMQQPKVAPRSVFDLDPLERVTSSASQNYSRFEQEFECEKLLGKGAFGNVFKARNKLDGNSYAIKRLILNYNYKARVKKILNEVQVLSQLNHSNVVRYNNAWTEAISSEELERIKVRENEEQAGESEWEGEGEEEEEASQISREEVSEGTESRLQPIDEDDELESYQRSMAGSFRQSQLESASSVRHLNISFKKDLDLIEEEGEKNPDKMRYLYIQMEACEQQTLRDVIDSGELRRNPQETVHLLTQMLDAFTYIHQKAMIHRDVKPANIFLLSKGASWDVKLGDFGLASKGGVYSEQPQGDKLSELSAQELSSGVGTPIYMSPEQQHGKKYDSQADMYSLGIILYEMLYGPFRTESERIVTIAKLKQDKALPKDFDLKCGPRAQEVRGV